MDSQMPTATGRKVPNRRPLRRERVWQIAALLLLVLVSGIGCDPISTMSYFLLPFSDNNLPPTGCALTLPSKESTVLIICTHEDSVVTDLELKTADIEICTKLVRIMTDQFKENDDKVKIVPVSKVYGYLREHPDWITMSKQAIGKHFNADFVVYLELGPMSMWEEGSRKTLYRGKAEVRMSVIETDQAEGEAPKWCDVYNLAGYPSTAPEDSSTSPVSFRQRFYQRIAKDLALYFVAHPQSDRADFN